MPNRSERVIDYSVYLNAADYLGTATATLPEITYLVDTIKGAGLPEKWRRLLQGIRER